MNKTYLYSLIDLETKEIIDQIEINKKDYELASILLFENNTPPNKYEISYEEINYTRDNCIIDDDLNFNDDFEDDEFFNDDVF